MAENNFNLGVSENVFQFSHDQVMVADVRFNQLLVSSVCYSAIGLVTGAAASILFKKKVPVIAYTTGLGLGFAFHRNANELIKHIRSRK